MAAHKILVAADVSNLYYCVKRRYNAKLDYEKYLHVCQQYGDIYKAIAYGARLDTEADNFIEYLQHRGFETQYKRTRIHGVADGRPYRKADWDVGIAIDVIRHLKQIDFLILGSADADMIPLVSYVQEHDVPVAVVACNIAIDLKQACNYWQEIDELMLSLRGNYAYTETA